MSKKSKKTKAAKQTPFDVGLDAQQILADNLCDQFLKVGVEEDVLSMKLLSAYFTVWLTECSLFLKKISLLKLLMKCRKL